MKSILNNFALMAACSFCLLSIPVLGNEGTAIRAENAKQPKEKSGIGSSMKNPIVLKGVKSLEQIREAQEKHISQLYPDSSIEINNYSMDDERFIQFFVVETKEGKMEFVYFDMTDTYRKISNSKGKKIKEKIKELKDKHMPQ